MWAVSGATLGVCARKLRRSTKDHLVPLMGVLGAFVFAAQMINFSIPGTGSSGHLGGGMLLAALLGPYAAFVVITSVLVIQALFFSDGGLLALGCNIFNLGFFPAFVAYPLIFRAVVGDRPTRGRIFAGSLAGCVMGLEMGAFGVVLETVASGITELPFSTFVAFMLPIHLAIGLVEGIVTGLVVNFVHEANPQILSDSLSLQKTSPSRLPVKTLAALILGAALVTGGLVSWYASEFPDGLEWSMARVSGREELDGSSPVHDMLASLQERIAVLPDYSFRSASAADDPSSLRAGTTVSGIAGSLMVLCVSLAIGYGLHRWKSAGDRRGAGGPTR